MKKILISMAASIAIATALSAQTKVNEKMTIYDLQNNKLHVYQTGDAMGDVSFIIEGEKKLVIHEQPLFWDNIKEFNSYVSSLDKPVDKVIANYHSLGLADYAPSAVVMPKAMIEFGKSDMAQGMIAKFEKGFGEAADFRAHKKAKGFDVPSIQNWAGIELVFTNGAKTDFPAASILIDRKAYYVHFAPEIAHANPMRVKSPESVDVILDELYEIKKSGAEYIFGSHGKPATLKEVDFQILYFEKIKSLLKECPDSDVFGQRLIVSYPTLAGAENVKAIATALYPNQAEDQTKELVRTRVQDYFNMVSNLDMDIAKGLWAERSDISIITPKTQFFGFDNIMNDFLIKAFSSMQSRKLSSLSEVINIYGSSANVQLYWVFDTVDAQGEKHQTRGRESLIFEKIGQEWKLVHVHYSRMPQ